METVGISQKQTRKGGTYRSPIMEQDFASREEEVVFDLEKFSRTFRPLLSHTYWLLAHGKASPPFSLFHHRVLIIQEISFPYVLASYCSSCYFFIFFYSLYIARTMCRNFLRSAASLRFTNILLFINYFI